MPAGQATAACGGILTDILTILVLVLTAPLFLFGGFLMSYVGGEGPEVERVTSFRCQIW